MGLTIDLSNPGGLFVALLPELVLTGWALVILLAAAWRHRDEADQQLAGQLALQQRDPDRDAVDGLFGSRTDLGSGILCVGAARDGGNARNGWCD